MFVRACNHLWHASADLALIGQEYTHAVSTCMQAFPCCVQVLAIDAENGTSQLFVAAGFETGTGATAHSDHLNGGIHRASCGVGRL